MEIKPTYISFEQAKWLKEKGFDEKTWSYYYDGELHHGVLDDGEVKWNSDSDYSSHKCQAAPEQHIVIEWLRVNHNIHVQPEKRFHKEGYYVGKIHISNSSYANPFSKPFNSPQEAYSAAFNYIKDHNLI